MKEGKWIGAVCIGLILSLVPNGLGQPREQQHNSANISADNKAYQAVTQEQNSQKKLRLLEDFVARYPHSTLIASAYRDYSIAYFTMQKFPASVDYADKFLASISELSSGAIDPRRTFIDLRDGMFGGAPRLDGLYLRAQAYFQGCYESAFHTPEAYTRAENAAKQGLRELVRWQDHNTPDDATLKEGARRTFEAVAAIAESSLEGKAPAASCKAALAPDPGKFSGMLDKIK